MVLHEPNPMALVAYAIARPAAPLIVWFHSEVIRARWKYRLFYEPLLNWVLRRAARIVVAAPPMRDVPALAAHRDKVAVIPYGLDPRAYAGARRRRCRTPERYADRAVRRQARGLQGRGRAAARHGGRAGLARRRRRRAAAWSAGSAGEGTWCLRRRAFSRSRQRRRAARVVSARRPVGAALGEPAGSVRHGPGRSDAVPGVRSSAPRCRPACRGSIATASPAWWCRPGMWSSFAPRCFVSAATRHCDRRWARAPAHGRWSTSPPAACARAIDELCGAVGRPRARPQPRESRLFSPKRALDVALAGTGLIASAPLWALIALCIKLEDGGPVFYGQERSGLNGRPFRVRKFRSMIPDAEAATGAIQATEHDPRVTRVGRVLRATAMDELPQLWNIFRGDMSFTGPRALRPGEIEVLGGDRVELLEDVPGFTRRASVRPGLTGVAQIYAARDITAPPQVPLRPAVRPPPVAVARCAADRAVVLDHVPRHVGVRGRKVLDDARGLSALGFQAIGARVRQQPIDISGLHRSNSLVDARCRRGGWRTGGHARRRPGWRERAATFSSSKKISSPAIRSTAPASSRAKRSTSSISRATSSSTS